LKNKACIVLPTYNEVQNIPILIPWIFEEAKKIETHEVHVLIVDDNSPDGTQGAVRSLTDGFPNLHLITGEKKGLGEAYKRGFDHAIKRLSLTSFLKWTPTSSIHPPSSTFYFTGKSRI